MKTNYKIKGCHQGQTETLSTTFTEKEALRLVEEYQIAYGKNWVIWAEGPENENPL